jgi:hypothetical protein
MEVEEKMYHVLDSHATTGASLGHAGCVTAHDPQNYMAHKIFRYLYVY